MFSRITLINIVLAGLFIFFGIKSIAIWSGGANTVLETPLSEKPGDKPRKKVAKSKTPPESGYELIVEKNLFSTDRAEPKPREEKKAPPQDNRKVKAYADKLLLYGVIVMDDYKKALVHNPKPAKGEKKSRWVTEGDRIGHLTVISIERDSVRFKGGDKEYLTLLYDKDRPKKRTPVVKDPVPANKGKKSRADKQPSEKKGIAKDKPKIPNNPFEKLTNRLRGLEKNE
ncbi:MAG: hypothetical protein GY864_01865 [Desulfobacterales bacterium]|nr:hypothetical protein [Desulfobacterales bacterium]